MAHTEAYRIKKQTARVAKERANALAFLETIPGNMIFTYSTTNQEGLEEIHLEAYNRLTEPRS